MPRLIVALVLGTLAIAAGASAQTQTTPASPKPAAPSSMFLPQPATPFPEGARIGFINFQTIAEKSAAGQAATMQLTKLQNVKFAELDSKARSLKALQDQTTSAVALTPSASAKLQKDIERAQMDIQYSRQMAQREIDDLTEEVMNDLTARIKPAVEEVRSEKSLWAVFMVSENFVALMPGLDLSMEVVKRLDTKK